MTLDLDFDFVLDETSSLPDSPLVIESVETVPVAVEKVRATPVSGTSYLAKPDDQWGWQDLRDYICTEIEARHGAQVRDPKKEASIVKAFMSRWGTPTSVRIARTAFTVHDGMWRGAPISINRFCLASDKWFAGVIAQNF